MDPLNELAAVQQNRSPALPYARRARRRSYRARVGLRSFIFQILLVAWTGILLFAATFVFEPAYDASLQHLPPGNKYRLEDEADKTTWYIARMAGVWSGIALPLAIAAVFTMKAD